jgi:zinc transport system ATP-binding protein
MTTPAVQATGVSVELGGLPVLRGITMTVAPGEVVALLGGNGSGKSTLVRTLLGLVPAQHGTIELFGQPIARLRSWARIGYVPQRSPVSQSGAKVKEAVASGRLAQRAPFRPTRTADRAAVARALAAVGLTDRSDHRLSELSGGQQQRALIARALVGDPDLLVLDEPTAGVDLVHQQVVAEILSDLVGAGSAVVIVLHEVGNLAGLIDRAVVLREGRIVHDGVLGTLGQAHRQGGGHEHEGAPDAPELVRGPVER